MKVFISGGTGFIGVELINKLIKENYNITMLTRSKKIDRELQEKITVIYDDPNKTGDWQKSLADQDIVINLAGAPIFKRWNKKVKNEIYNSRINTTKNIVKWLSQYNNKKVLN